MNIAQHECVNLYVALNMQHAKHEHHFVVCGLPQNFSTLSHKRHDLIKNGIEYKMCVSSVSTTFILNIFRCK
jgi:predicted peroxiredoxin